MAQTVSLSASPRQATGKGAARQARFRGRVPAVIYGHGRDTQPLELEAKALEKALQVRDLSIPNAKILTDAELTIATVVPPRAEEVAAPSPEAATEVAEPELIRKVREGEEEEGEGGAAAEGGAPAKPEAKGGGGAAPAKGEKTEKDEKPKGGKEC